VSFRHVSVLRLNRDVTARERDEIVVALRALPTTVPGIEHYRVGIDAGLADDNFDLAIVADFVDRDAYTTYRDHPSHQDVLRNMILPKLDARAAVQHEVDD
jgi:hypothetical protein